MFAVLSPAKTHVGTMMSNVTPYRTYPKDDLRGTVVIIDYFESAGCLLESVSIRLDVNVQVKTPVLYF